jgi:micrococcal nuclease
VNRLPAVRAVGAALVLLVTLLLIACDAEPQPAGTLLQHPDPRSLELAAVERVIDGDTLDVRIAGETRRVRLFGIDTPERGERCEGEATDRLRELAGESVRLRRDTRLQDPNGRDLRYLYTESGRSIDATMLAEGLAEPWTADGALRDDLILIAASARQDEIGCLWSGG